jgi:hypothetical protein
MCCGESEADMKARAEMSDDRPPVASDSYVGLYTTVEGAEIQIGTWGFATNTRCAIVSPEVAAELACDPQFSTLPRWEHTIAPPAVEFLYHAENGKVHHTFPDCPTGNDIEPENRREGTGGKRLCSECKKLAREGEE